MADRRDPNDLRSGATPALAAGSSWMALLAATTLGVDGSTVRALVRTEAPEIDEQAVYTLVVQSYDGSMLHGARPVGSVQRIVTGAELRRGLEVSLVELRSVAAPTKSESKKTSGKKEASQAQVVAWIADGHAELEFDARGARPAPDSVFGTTRKTAGAGTVQISLSRKLAA